MTSRFIGSNRLKEGGQLVTHKHDFEIHRMGQDWRHTARHIDMDPPLPNFSAPDVQTTLEQIAAFIASDGSGFVSIGNVTTDGYAVGSYNVGSTTTPTLVDAFNAAFNDARLENGGIILVLAGTYRLFNTIVLPPGISVMGEIAGTVIVGEMPELPMFRVSAGTDVLNVGGDDGSGAINLAAGAPVDETKLFNLILADNLDGYIQSSGQSVSSMQTVPMVLCERASRLTCEEVKFVGRVNDGAIAGRGKTLRAIGYAGGGGTATHLTVKRCFFDGMQTAIDFSPGNGDIDHLVVDSCNARVFGTEDGGSTAPEDNCFLTMSFCNAQLTNNHITGFGTLGTQFFETCFVITVAGGGGTDVNSMIAGNTGQPVTGGTGTLLVDLTGLITLNTAIHGNNFGSNFQTSYGLGTSLFSSGRTRPLASEWAVTVGDGINTFGDFVGSNAIHQALSVFAASAFEACRIQVKAGVYEVNAANGPLTIPAGKGLVMEGVDSFTTGLSAEIRVTDASAVIIDMLVNSRLNLKHLFITGPAATAFRAIDMGSGCTLNAEYCELNCKVTGLNAQSMHIRDCNFGSPVAFANDAHITMEFGDSALKGKFLFEDCFFGPADDHPVLRVRADAGAVLITHIESFEFVRCQMLLGTTRDDGFGNMIGNCGVIDLDANGSDIRFFPGLATGVMIRKLVYKDCIVEASAGGAVHCLIHLIPQPNGVSFASGEYMGVLRLEIDGGRWQVPAEDTQFNPFTALEVGLPEAGFSLFIDLLGTQDEGGIFIRNVLFGYHSIIPGAPVNNQGAPTADIDDRLWMGLGDPAPAQSVFGWMSVGTTRTIELDNLDFFGMNQLGTSAHLAVRWDKATIRNIRMDGFRAGGPGTSSRHIQLRVRRPLFSEYVHVKDIRLTGRNTTVGSWGHFVYIEPYGAPSNALAPNVLVDGLRINKFTQGGGLSPASGHAVRVTGFETSGSLFTGSDGNYQNMTIRNCAVRNVAALISYSTPAAPQLFRNIKVKDNDCINTSSFGISFPSLNFAAPITFDRIEIIGNRLEFCGLQGIFVGAVLWADLFGVTSVMITNNTVLNCNGGAAATQISLVMIGGVPNQRVHGICRDNICSTIPDPPTSLGGIQVNSNDGAGAIVAVHTAAGSQPANYLEAQVPLRGISTGWPYTGAATQERFVVGSGLTAAMIYNYARLVSP